VGVSATTVSAPTLWQPTERENIENVAFKKSWLPCIFLAYDEGYITLSLSNQRLERGCGIFAASDIRALTLASVQDRSLSVLNSDRSAVVARSFGTFHAETFRFGGAPMSGKDVDIEYWSRIAAEWTAWARAPNHDAFWAYRASLLAFIGQGAGDVLDVGCGEGRVSRVLKDCGYRVTAIDPVE
jgi:Methyltransferase domain